MTHIKHVDARYKRPLRLTCTGCDWELLTGGTLADEQAKDAAGAHLMIAHGVKHNENISKGWGRIAWAGPEYNHSPLPRCQLENWREYHWTGEAMTSDPTKATCVPCIQLTDGDLGGTRDSAIADPLRSDALDVLNWGLNRNGY